MADSIPLEIQMEIVKRVPVKSLLQFRSVSKSWKSLIDNHQFIADYNAYESRPQRLIIRYRCDPKHYASVCIVDDDIFPQNKFKSDLRYYACVFPQYKHRITTCPKSFEQILVGSSQGLLCLWDAYRVGKAYIWNPAIRKSIVIRVPKLCDLYRAVLGFGVTNEPMLVMIINDDSDEMFWRVEVFTLSSRVWRRLFSNLLPRRSIRFARSQVAINGFIYWQTYDRLIVSFDMKSEEFAEINLPRNFSYRRTKDLSIFNLRESLAMAGYCMDAEKQVCAVWMMEHGVPKSFTKLFTVATMNACFTKVMGFRNNGEVILEVADTDDCYKPAVLEVYEPRSELIKDLGIHGKRGRFFVSSYRETLLLLDQADNQHIVK